MNHINRLSFQDFIQLFGGVVERGPLVAGAVWGRAPFSCAEDILAAVCAFLDALPSQGKMAVLRLYPDFAGTLVNPNALSGTGHRSTADSLSLTDEETGILEVVNAKYRDKFQFPFIFDSKQTGIETVLSEIQARVQNPGETELENSIREVKKIAWNRIVDVIRNQSIELEV